MGRPLRIRAHHRPQIVANGSKNGSGQRLLKFSAPASTIDKELIAYGDSNSLASLRLSLHDLRQQIRKNPELLCRAGIRLPQVRQCHAHSPPHRSAPEFQRRRLVRERLRLPKLRLFVRIFRRIQACRIQGCREIQRFFRHFHSRRPVSSRLNTQVLHRQLVPPRSSELAVSF
jgi:hypothetical protein